MLKLVKATLFRNDPLHYVTLVNHLDIRCDSQLQLMNIHKFTLIYNHKTFKHFAKSVNIKVSNKI